MNDLLNIRSITSRTLTPAVAEVEISLDDVAGELRGRLAGPSCRFAATVEVAYPLRQVEGQPLLRATIPEPCLWEPQSPFLYRGAVELWRDGKLQRKTQISHGLRSLAIGQAGLRLNGKSLILDGVARDKATEAELLNLRRSGCNALLAPAHPLLWRQADQLGFLMIGRASAGWEEIAQRQHPSALGWLLQCDQAVPNLHSILGLELAEPFDGLAPAWASFVTCSRELLSQARRLGLPVLLLSDDQLKTDSAVLGWIRP